mmetsp:Transcript_13260/g.23344  ORF Transcript_13260/g.23344 Transcript_13260/m.23344 type:complete len:343 (-) Transcript_13260:45-1073(-)
MLRSCSGARTNILSNELLQGSAGLHHYDIEFSNNHTPQPFEMVQLRGDLAQLSASHRHLEGALRVVLGHLAQHQDELVHLKDVQEILAAEFCTYVFVQVIKVSWFGNAPFPPHPMFYFRRLAEQPQTSYLAQLLYDSVRANVSDGAPGYSNAMAMCRDMDAMWVERIQHQHPIDYNALDTQVATACRILPDSLRATHPIVGAVFHHFAAFVEAGKVAQAHKARARASAAHPGTFVPASTMQAPTLSFKADMPSSLASTQQQQHQQPGSSSGVPNPRPTPSASYALPPDLTTLDRGTTLSTPPVHALSTTNRHDPALVRPILIEKISAVSESELEDLMQLLLI